MKKALIVSGIVGILAMLIHYFASLTLEQQYDSGWIDFNIITFGILGTIGLVATFICYIIWHNSSIWKELFGVVTVVNIFFILMLIYEVLEIAFRKEILEKNDSFLVKTMGYIFGSVTSKPKPPIWLVYTEFLTGFIAGFAGITCYVLTSTLYAKKMKEEKINN